MAQVFQQIVVEGLASLGSLNVLGPVTANGPIGPSGSGFQVFNNITVGQVGSTSSLTLRRAQGSFQVPSAILTGQVVATVQANGFDGAAFQNAASLTFTALENWTSIARGIDAKLNVTPIGSVTQAAAIVANPSTTAADVRMQVFDVTGGILQQVSIGAANSGGAGFRLLRIPN